MGAPRFSEWTIVPESGEIPEELLPCGLLQYRWSLVYIWTPDDFWWGISGGLFWFRGNLAIGEDLVSEDKVTFVCTVFGIGGVIDLWTYYPGTMNTTGPDSCPVFGSPQLDWQYDPAFGSAGFGIDQLFIVGVLQSPIYKVSLNAGATFDPLTFRPQYALEGTWALEVRTAPAGVTEDVQYITDQTGDHHHFRVYRDALLARRYLSAFRSFDGAQSGLGVTAGAGLTVNVAAGRGYFGHRPCELEEAETLTVPASSTSCIWARPRPVSAYGQTVTGIELLVTAEGTTPSGQAYLLAMVTAGDGSISSVDGVARGTVVAWDVDGYSGAKAENGLLWVAYDSGGALDIRKRSGDGGLTWVDG
jgi:hypothetical protein